MCKYEMEDFTVRPELHAYAVVPEVSKWVFDASRALGCLPQEAPAM